MASAFEHVFPIGLGTARFPFLSPDTYKSDFVNAVDLVLYALEKGINYIDVGEGYSNDHAFSVLREAFQHTDKYFHTTIKINSFDLNCTADQYYRKACKILRDLGLRQASHFLIWTLMDKKMFQFSISKGHIYDAALRLREEGLIKYIGTSVHMQHDDIMDVIDSGLFEFVLVSYNLLNFLDMQRVLDRAFSKNVDILVMNPLYGGLIPQNPEMFEYARFSVDETVVQAAIRAVLSHPAVKCILAGASNIEQLDKYLSALDGFSLDEDSRKERVQWLKNHITTSNTFCSYCRYCAECPQKIPVPEIMNARNLLSLRRKTESDFLAKTYLRFLHEKFNLRFETSKNPCIRCGRCENRCTQHLNIMDSVHEIYDMVGKTCYDMESRKKRFEELLNKDGYKKIGFWPASDGTMKILSIYKEIFKSISFEVFLFDSNKNYHGKKRFGYVVHSEQEALSLGVDCMLITSYQYRKIIHEQIDNLEQDGIAVKELYREGDVDWWW